MFESSSAWAMKCEINAIVSDNWDSKRSSISSVILSNITLKGHLIDSMTHWPWLMADFYLLWKYNKWPFPWAEFVKISKYWSANSNIFIIKSGFSFSNEWRISIKHNRIIISISDWLILVLSSPRLKLRVSPFYYNCK